MLPISLLLLSCFVIITPSSANGWRNSGPQLLEWQLAGSDPVTFAVVLTSVDGTVNQLLAAEVDSSRWSTDVNPPSGGWPVGTSFNFRVHFVKDANDPNTIYASSQVFNIEAVVPEHNTTSSAPVPYTPRPTSSTISSTTLSSSGILTTSSSSSMSTVLSSSATSATLSASATSATLSSNATSALSSSATSATLSSSAVLTPSSSATLTSSSCGRSTSSSLTAISTFSPSTPSSTPSTTPSTTPLADKTTTSTPPHQNTSPQYSTSYISTDGAGTTSRAEGSSSIAIPGVQWRTFS